MQNYFILGGLGVMLVQFAKVEKHPSVYTGSLFKDGFGENPRNSEKAREERKPTNAP